MQKVTLVCVGSVKTHWVREGVLDYQSRLRGFFQFTLKELPASKHANPKEQKAEESKRIMDFLHKHRGKTCILDERGKQYSSPEFSAFLARFADTGDELCFVIGGAYGFTDAVRKSADYIISMSAFVLPHELCRIFFLEQLYRAAQIARGTGYHHA